MLVDANIVYPTTDVISFKHATRFLSHPETNGDALCCKQFRCCQKGSNKFL